MKQILSIVAAASVALAGLAAVPIHAQEYDGNYGYQQDDGQDRDSEHYHRYNRYQQVQRDEYRNFRSQDRRDEYYARRNGRYYDAPRFDHSHYQAYQDGSGDRPYRDARRCHSGTTGAILGAVVGGLLGREIGRGGEFNDPSTTGLILGASGGALAGRAIERSGCH